MILFFTGTGNSQYAAQAIGTAMGETPVSINDYLKKKEYPALTSETPWIFVMPTYAWRIPHVVEDFIRRSSFTGNRKACFILTCGDSIGNAGGYAEKLCGEVGLLYGGMADLPMPENFITMFRAPAPEEEKQIMARADKRLEEIIADLKAGRQLTQRCGRRAYLSAVVNPVFYRLFVKAGPYRVKESCTACGFCEEICPLGNIRLENGRPVWGTDCTQCMACICGCPQEAIEYGRKSVGKRRYWCKSFDKGAADAVK